MCCAGGGGGGGCGYAGSGGGFIIPGDGDGTVRCLTTGLSSDVSRQTFSRFLFSLDAEVTDIASGCIESSSCCCCCCLLIKSKFPMELLLVGAVCGYWLSLERDSFMLPPPCFRSKLENLESTEHHTFSPVSSIIQYPPRPDVISCWAS